MEKAGLCMICGKGAWHTCSLCGKLVCDEHFDPETRMCSQCVPPRAARKERRERERPGLLT